MERCLTDEQLEALVRASSGGAEALANEARLHLDACRTCQDLVALLAPVPDRSGAEGETRTGAKPQDETLLGRFRVVRELGRGGMGIVYMVWDPKLRRALAVKLLHSTDPSAEQRMQREAQALARLNHPNIVTVFDVGIADDGVYMMMELVRGPSLRAWLERSADHEARDVIAMFLQAGEGLSVAHRAGIVHRDFKPENVLVGDDGRVRMVDFGLAHADAIPDRSEAEGETRAEAGAVPGTGGETRLLSLTRSGLVVGTPAYMAPEQHRGQLADARSDQFSFCVALWEALYGARPFAGNTAAEIAHHIERGAIAGGERALRDPVAKILVRGLSANPLARFATMAALLDELRAPHAPSPVAKVRVAVASAIVAVACALAFVAQSVSGHGTALASDVTRWEHVAHAAPAEVSVTRTTLARDDAAAVTTTEPARTPARTQAHSRGREPKVAPRVGANGAPLID